MEQKNFKTQEEERAYYDDLLKNLIPNLNKYSFLHGAEGKAYFIDDNFVVKELTIFDSYDYFNMFFNEMVEFEKRGLSVPKFYAWAKGDNEDEEYKRVYILQERVKGKNLFVELYDIYDKVKNICSESDFLCALGDPANHQELYTQIIYTFINDVNEKLGSILSVPEKEIDRFIVSLFELYNNAEFSRPDIHAGNVFCDGKTLTIIDEWMYDSAGVFDGDYKYSKEKIMKRLLEDIFIMFDVFYCFAYMHEFNVEIKDKVVKAKKDVLKRAFGTIKKFVKKSQKLLNYENGWQHLDFLNEATDILGEELGKQLVKEIEKE